MAMRKMWDNENKCYVFYTTKDLLKMHKKGLKGIEGLRKLKGAKWNGKKRKTNGNNQC